MNMNDDDLIIEQLFGDQVTIHGLKAYPLQRCHLGHTSTPEYLWTKSDFEYYQCPDCSLVWITPQLTDESIAQIYARSFRSKAFLSYKRLLQSLESYKRAGGTLLDVGTFTGNLLIAARDVSWKHVEETEISAEAIEFARYENNLTTI